MEKTISGFNKTLTHTEEIKIIGLLEAGSSGGEIAEKLDIDADEVKKVEKKVENERWESGEEVKEEE